MVQIWNLKPGWGSRPDIYIEKGHSDDITGLKFSSDGRILLSRSFDGSMKVIMFTYIKCLLNSFLFFFWPISLLSFLSLVFHLGISNSSSVLMNGFYSRSGICAK